MSNINTTNIDGTFPIAGQDNDSQGFRSNFTNIINNFVAAKTEIEELQAKAVLKSQLSSEVSLNNDLAGGLLRSASVVNFRELRASPEPSTAGGVSAYTINHASGHYQKITPENPFTLAFSNFPAAGYLGRVRLEVELDDVGYTMTLPASVTIGKAGIAGLSGNVITFTETGNYIFEFTSHDGGTNYSIDDLTRSRDYIPSSRIRLLQGTPAVNGVTGDRAGMIAVDDDNIYVCDGDYNGTTPIWRAVKTGTGAVSLSTSRSPSILSTLEPINGLSFTALPGVRYKFESLIPFTVGYDGSTISSHAFSVQFSNGTCNYLVEQQTSPTSAFTLYASSTSEDDNGSVSATDPGVRFAKVSGTFTHSESTPVSLSLMFSISAGSLTALAGASLKWERVN